MGGALSHLGSNLASMTPTSLKGLVKSAGLPLEVDDSFSSSDLHEPKKPPPPSAYTEPYSAEGYFTGVRSTITIQRSPSIVYDSLSKDLHHVFTPITECEDTMEEDDHSGAVQLFRVVRIPFRVACVSGTLKMRLRVNQDRRTRKIHFDSLKEGRLIKKFLATFEIVEAEPGRSTVHLDAKISAAQLPPPPFKGLVKAVMISKIDNCMLDLLAYHEKAVADEKERGSAPKPWTNLVARAGSSLRRSLDLSSHRVASGELESTPASPKAASKPADKAAVGSSPQAEDKVADKGVTASPEAALQKTDKLAMTSRGPKLAD